MNTSEPYRHPRINLQHQRVQVFFTRKSVSGIIEEEEEMVIEGQSSCEVIDVDDFETAVDKGRTNTRMKPKARTINQGSVLLERE